MLGVKLNSLCRSIKNKVTRKNSEESYQTRYYFTKVAIQKPFDIVTVAYTKIQKITW